MTTRLLLVVTSLVATSLAQSPLPRPTDSPPPGRVATAENATSLEGLALEKARAGLGAGPTRVLFDRPRDDGPWWAIGASWKASFDRGGFTFVPFFGSQAPQNHPLRVEVAAASIGGTPLAVGQGEPVVADGQVRTPRGPFVEVVDTRLDHVEQSFVFDRLPSRGAITVDVRITTDLVAATIENGVRFANDLGHVDYTKALALDAAGRQLPLTIDWDGGTARMTIPAAFVESATLPIVLDPVLNGWFNLSGGAIYNHDMEVASYQSNGGRTLVVYQRQASLVDQDCWGILFDGNLGLVLTDFVIDASFDDWLHVAVAANNYAQNFLVVAEIRIGLQWFIGGRRVGGSGPLGFVFDIEREGVIGTPGQNHEPDVGSDPYYGVGRYTVVFTKRAPGVADVYMKQVATNGGLVSTNAFPLLPNSNDEELRPSISKSCGQPNLPQRWLITWERTWPFAPNDHDVWGRFVDWNGVFAGGPFAIQFSTAEERRSAPCSPIDVDGARYYPVCYEKAPVQNATSDVWCSIVRSDSTLAHNFMVTTGVPLVDENSVRVDSDGTRFTAIYQVWDGSNGGIIEATTMAWLPASTTIRIDHRSNLGLPTNGAFLEPAIWADYSAGTGVTPRYVLTWKNEGNNTFNMNAFGGWMGGTSFFSTFASQCGNLSIAASGSPVIGQTVTIQVGSAPFSGTILGFPGYIPLNALGCNCVQGVQNGLYLGNPLHWTVPNNPAFVGITLSAQGWSITGTQCLGFVDLSDTIDFTIR
jgi:hypothetical protein